MPIVVDAVGHLNDIASIGVHDEDVFMPAVASGVEGDLGSVGRPVRRPIHAGAVGQIDRILPRIQID